MAHQVAAGILGCAAGKHDPIGLHTGDDSDEMVHPS
jgi:hypothetical protein